MGSMKKKKGRDVVFCLMFLPCINKSDDDDEGRIDRN